MVAEWVALLALVGQTPPAIATPPEARQLQAWLPGEVRCDGVAVAATTLRRPYLALTYPGAEPPPAVEYRFRLDAAGRPLSIRREGERYAPFAEDIAPSLAASRFVVGGERTGCTIVYAARRTGYAQTPLADLISYTLNPGQGQLPREGWAAIFPPAATCDDAPHPGVLLQAYPDFARLPGTPGVRDWTMLAYDLDAKGRPQHVAVLTGTGNQALDAGSIDAMQRSRYASGPRTGCRYPYWKAAATMAAPAAPDQGAFRPAAATCPASVTWASQPTLVFPEPYRRRAIEGWAIIGFDVAPWGATGNAKVLASEPAADFGQAALQVVRAATVAPTPAGYTGCVERVRFAMSRPGSPANTTGGASIPTAD